MSDSLCAMTFTRLLVALSIVLAACSGSSEGTTTVAPTSTEATTTTSFTSGISIPTTVPPQTFEDAGAALAFLFEFNPLTGNAGELRDALERAGGHRFGLATAEWLLLGNEAIQEVVIDALSQGGQWNAQILTAMIMYGTPLGTYEVRQKWDPNVRVGLVEAQRAAMTETYGDAAAIALVVQQRMLESEILRCFDEPTCEWPGVWYDPPQSVALIEGSPTGSTFVGEVGIVSDTGELLFIPITLEQTADQWLITDGYLTEVRTPVVIVENPIDGIHIVEDFAALFGFAEPGSTVTVGTEVIVIDGGQYWEAGVSLEPGRNDITVRVSNASGGEATIQKVVFHHPNGEERLGYVTLGETPGTLQFNEVTILYGAEADAAAIADGVIAEGSTLPGGFYIFDEDPLDVVEVPLVAEPFVILFDSAIEAVPVSYESFVSFLGGATSTGYYGNLPTEPYWLLIDGGEAVQIQQQYVP